MLSLYEDMLLLTSWFTDQTCCDISYVASIKSFKFNLLIKLTPFSKEAQNFSGQQRRGSKSPPVDLARQSPLVDTYGGR